MRPLIRIAALSLLVALLPTSPCLASSAGLTKAQLLAIHAPVLPYSKPSAYPVDLHQVTILLATYPGVRKDSTTTQYLTALVNNWVNEYWKASSSNQISFKVKRAISWKTLTAAPCSSQTQVAAPAFFTQAVKASGWVAAKNQNLLVYTPADPNCGQTVGFGLVATSTTSKGYAWVNTTTPAVLAHELGHNLGLDHSQLLHCVDATGADTPDAPPASCSMIPYRDTYDVMGMGTSGALADIPHQLLITKGFAPAYVQSSGTYQVGDIQGSSYPTSLELHTINGDYYLEYRHPTVTDSAQAPGGLLVHKMIPPGTSFASGGVASKGESYLLDAALSPATPFSISANMTLPVGATITLAGGDIQLTLASQDDLLATIEVSTTPGVTLLP